MAGITCCGLRCPASCWNGRAANAMVFRSDAIGAVSASRFARCELLEFIQASRAMSRLTIDVAAEELKRSQDQMLFLGRGVPEEQLIAFLASWRRRLPRRADRFVSLPMSRRDIAAHLGMAPETLTRTFAKLERKEIIEVVADGVVLLDARESPGRGKKPVLGTQDSFT